MKGGEKKNKKHQAVKRASNSNKHNGDVSGSCWQGCCMDQGCLEVLGLILNKPQLANGDESTISTNESQGPEGVGRSVSFDHHNKAVVSFEPTVSILKNPISLEEQERSQKSGRSSKSGLRSGRSSRSGWTGRSSRGSRASNMMRAKLSKIKHKIPRRTKKRKDDAAAHSSPFKDVTISTRLKPAVADLHSNVLDVTDGHPEKVEAKGNNTEEETRQEDTSVDYSISRDDEINREGGISDLTSFETDFDNHRKDEIKSDKPEDNAATTQKDATKETPPSKAPPSFMAGWLGFSPVEQQPHSADLHHDNNESSMNAKNGRFEKETGEVQGDDTNAAYDMNNHSKLSPASGASPRDDRPLASQLGFGGTGTYPPRNHEGESVEQDIVEFVQKESSYHAGDYHHDNSRMVVAVGGDDYTSIVSASSSISISMNSAATVADGGNKKRRKSTMKKLCFGIVMASCLVVAGVIGRGIGMNRTNLTTESTLDYIDGDEAEEKDESRPKQEVVDDPCEEEEPVRRALLAATHHDKPKNIRGSGGGRTLMSKNTRRMLQDGGEDTAMSTSAKKKCGHYYGQDEWAGGWWGDTTNFGSESKSGKAGSSKGGKRAERFYTIAKAPNYTGEFNPSGTVDVSFSEGLTTFEVNVKGLDPACSINNGGKAASSKAGKANKAKANKANDSSTGGRCLCGYCSDCNTLTDLQCHEQDSCQFVGHGYDKPHVLFLRYDTSLAAANTGDTEDVPSSINVYFGKADKKQQQGSSCMSSVVADTTTGLFRVSKPESCNDGKDGVGTEVSIDYKLDDTPDVSIHTSCSVPIFLGMVIENSPFVLDGYCLDSHNKTCSFSNPSLGGSQCVAKPDDPNPTSNPSPHPTPITIVVQTPLPTPYPTPRPTPLVRNPTISDPNPGDTGTMFDPNSSLTSYKSAGCGPRGHDADADLSQCSRHGYIMVQERIGEAPEIVSIIDGCQYFSFQVYECVSPPAYSSTNQESVGSEAPVLEGLQQSPPREYLRVGSMVDGPAIVSTEADEIFYTNSSCAVILTNGTCNEPSSNGLVLGSTGQVQFTVDDISQDGKELDDSILLFHDKEGTIIGCGAIQEEKHGYSNHCLCGYCSDCEANSVPECNKLDSCMLGNKDAKPYSLYLKLREEVDQSLSQITVYFKKSCQVTVNKDSNGLFHIAKPAYCDHKDGVGTEVDIDFRGDSSPDVSIHSSCSVPLYAGMLIDGSPFAIEGYCLSEYSGSCTHIDQNLSVCSSGL